MKNYTLFLFLFVIYVSPIEKLKADVPDAFPCTCNFVGYLQGAPTWALGCKNGYSDPQLYHGSLMQCQAARIELKTRFEGLASNQCQCEEIDPGNANLLILKEDAAYIYPVNVSPYPEAGILAIHLCRQLENYYRDVGTCIASK